VQRVQRVALQGAGRAGVTPEGRGHLCRKRKAAQAIGQLALRGRLSAPGYPKLRPATARLGQPTASANPPPRPTHRLGHAGRPYRPCFRRRWARGGEGSCARGWRRVGHLGRVGVRVRVRVGVGVRVGVRVRVGVGVRVRAQGASGTRGHSPHVLRPLPHVRPMGRRGMWLLLLRRGPRALRLPGGGRRGAGRADGRVLRGRSSVQMVVAQAAAVW